MVTIYRYHECANGLKSKLSAENNDTGQELFLFLLGGGGREGIRVKKKGGKL